MDLRYIINVLLFFVTSHLMGQHGKPQINHKLPLHIAESLPLIKGKATVMDFGASYCGPCIKGLIKMQGLDKVFSDKMQFIFVTKEDSARFGRFLSHRPEIDPAKVRIMTGDTVLNTIFDHITEPHLVWIDKDSVLRAYTGSRYLDVGYIPDFLQGNTSDWQIKWDFQFDYHSPFINADKNDYNGIMPRHQTNFYVSSYLPGVLPRMGAQRDTTALKSRFYAVNIPIVKLYTYLWEREWDRNILPAQVITPLELKRKLLENQVNNVENNLLHVEWQGEGLLSNKQLKVAIRRYLDAYLSWKVELKKINRTCWVLKKIKEDQSKENLVIGQQQGVPLVKLIYDINHTLTTPFLIDESGLDGKSNWLKSLPSDINNLVELNELLKVLCLRIEEEQRIIEYLVISPDQ